MKQLFFLLIMIFPATLFAQDLTGTWEGQLEISNKKFDFYLYLSKSGSNNYAGVEYLKESFSTKFSLSNIDPLHLDKTRAALNSNVLKNDRSSVKASISGDFDNNVLTYTDLAFIETKGKNMNFQLGSLILNYSRSGNKEKLTVATDGFRGELKKKKSEFPLEYVQYATIDPLNKTSANRQSAKGRTANKTSAPAGIVPQPAPANEATGKEECLSGNCEDGIGTKNFAEYTYTGEFKNGKFEGQGTLTYKVGDVYKGGFSQNNFTGFGIFTYKSAHRSMFIKYFEGNWANDKLQGKAKFTAWDGEVFTVSTSDNRVHGYGERTKDGFSRIGYWDLDYYDGNYQGLELTPLRKYLDANFSKYDKVSSLTPCLVSLNSMGLTRVKYDEISLLNGKKVGESSDWEVTGASTDLKGFVNNTDHKIYIKAYRKVYPKEGGPAAYVDESFIVIPGMKILGNYRQLPEAGIVLDKFFQQEYFFLGQYAEKNKTSVPAKKKS